MDRQSRSIVGLGATIVAVGVALGTLTAMLYSNVAGNVAAGFDAVNSRFDAVDARFVSMENSINSRFDAVDRRFSEMRADSAAIRSEMREEHRVIQGQIERLDGRLDGLDRRTARIEGHLFGVELPDPSEPAPDSE